MNKTYTFYMDPEHGWLKVSKADCHNLGLWNSDFSHFSHKKGANLYLEEDRDIKIFLDKYRSIIGKLPILKESYCKSRSHIRSMEHIN